MTAPEQGQPQEPPQVREVEYFGSSVLLTAAVVLRGAGGWRLLSAGHVSDSCLWAEFEKDAP